MSDSNAALVELIWSGAVSGRYAPPAGADIGLDAGQQLQVAVMRRWEARGEVAGGWKLGMTSGRSRDRFGPGFRPFGYILASRILNTGDTLSIARVGRGGIENELCFTLGEPLGADATPEMARAAVTSVAPAFEINQLRIDGDASPGLSIADDLSNFGLVVGHAVPVPDDAERLFESMTVTLTRDGDAADTVSAAGHADDHFSSIATLSRGLAAHGLALAPGHRVITGAFTRGALQAGTWAGDFGASLGRVELELTP